MIGMAGTKPADVVNMIDVSFVQWANQDSDGRNYDVVVLCSSPAVLFTKMNEIYMKTIQHSLDLQFYAVQKIIFMNFFLHLS